MAIQIAQLMAKIGVDTGGAEDTISSFAAKLGMSGPVGMAVGAAIAGVAALGIASIKMAGDFQEGLTSLVTGAGESKSNLGLVSAGILQMARDTGTSTKDLISGMYMIGSAGYHGSAGLAVLQAAAEGAKVGNADLGTVADATTTIMNDFARSHVTAAQAVNTLIETVASGKTHMQDLAGALSQVLPTASTAKIGLNDVMGALATMTASGVPAADAATYLRQTIIALDAPSKAAQKAMEGVGLSSSAVAAEMQKSLPTALKMITDAVGKHFPAGSAAYVAALKDIAGGSKQMQGMLDLTGDHMKDFTTDVGYVADQVKKGGNSIQGWSDVQGDFNFKMSQAKEVAETYMIQLGQHLLPAATALISFITDKAIPALATLVQWFTGNSASAQIAKAMLLGVGIVIVATLVPAFVGWAIAAGAAAVATIAAMLPVILIGAAIGLLILGIKLLIDHWHQVSAVLGTVAGDIGRFVTGALGAIGNFVTSALGFLGGLVLKVIGFFFNLEVMVPLHLAQMALHGLATVVGFVGDFLRWLGTLELQALAKVADLAGGFLGAVGDLKDRVIATVAQLEIGFYQTLAALPGKLVALGSQMIQGLISGIRNEAGALAGAVKGVLDSIPGAGGLLSHIPGFAIGGTIPDTGWAIVGEHGPELVRMPNAQVIPQPSTRVSGGTAIAPVASSAGQMLQSTFVIQLDGRTIAQSTAKHLPGVIRLATGTRAF